ncbi:MAG: hypothetical protein CMO80_01200 [Verrucomicrobiales bacterium]|nr:hypothetical protein [Verrucomicrobiales bacterium]
MIKRTNAFALGLILIGLSAFGAGHGAEAQRIYFRNGDTLSGQMHGFDSRQGVQWQHASFTKPAWFGRSNLSGVFLRSLGSTNDVGWGRSVIRFANGDELMGRLHSITTNGFELETEAAGKLLIPRNQVATVWPRGTNDSVLYEGPNSDAVWTHGDINTTAGVNVGKWTFNNGAFVSAIPASVARNLNLPNEVRFDFRVQWQGFYRLAIGLHTDSLEPISLGARHLEPDFAPFYSLWLDNSVTELRVIPKEGDIRNMARVPLNFPPAKTNALISVFGSAKRKSVSIMADGRLIHEWVDTNGWSAGGKGIRFVHQGQGAVRLSEFRVSTWDAKTFPPLTVITHPKVDLLLDHAGKVAAGHLDVMTNGVFRFQSNGQWQERKYDDVRQLNFANDAVLNKHSTNESRVYLQGRGRLSGTLSRMNQTNALISVPGVGDLSLNSDRVVRLRFVP